jgi:hypothetical protein
MSHMYVHCSGKPMRTLGPVQTIAEKGKYEHTPLGKKIIQLIKLREPISRLLLALGVSTDMEFLR